MIKKYQKKNGIRNLAGKKKIVVLGFSGANNNWQLTWKMDKTEYETKTKQKNK